MQIYYTNSDDGHTYGCHITALDQLSKAFEEVAEHYYYQCEGHDSPWPITFGLKLEKNSEVIHTASVEWSIHFQVNQDD